MDTKQIVDPSKTRAIKLNNVGAVRHTQQDRDRRHHRFCRVENAASPRINSLYSKLTSGGTDMAGQWSSPKPDYAAQILAAAAKAQAFAQ